MSDDQREKAQKATEAREKAAEKIKELEEDPPHDLKDWPTDEAKYITLGGPEGEAGYDEGPTAKLGPSELRHHEDGSVSIGGEKVDNPEDYKGEPLPKDFVPDPRDRGEDKANDGSDENADDDSGEKAEDGGGEE